ncbi:hypothetical protein OG455_04920 [Kitasatospora sp. NBC_01287]|uniref:hypothetical protein n=1 Tax=Kitasatospora sp. NBC_01287 TaxID=2903573 RepID=UPI00224E7953|nr:hypothetical protein [Kitasatospora sp. NBC_01287]MCX4744868.1 hypothetical protein [Kitasatospora sp. NBC_01287]
MTIPQAPQSVIPPLFAGLCDDAAIFPPGDLPLPQAVPAHLAHRSSWYAPLVGPFLCGAGRIGTLAEQVDAVADQADALGQRLGTGGLPIGLIVPDGSAGLEPALRAVAAAPRLRLTAIEVPADRDGTAAEGVRKVRTALDKLLPEHAPGVVAAVEVARGPELLLALDELEGSPYRAKFRTGGTSHDAFPGELELASFLYAAVYRRLSFKCTAGLHHALRHDDPATGFEHHGFLNVLLATHAALDGAEHGELAALLRERDGAVLAENAADLSAAQVDAARAAFTGFGTCSIAEPLADLIALGLVTIP